MNTLLFYFVLFFTRVCLVLHTMLRSKFLYVVYEKGETEILLSRPTIITPCVADLTAVESCFVQV